MKWKLLPLILLLSVLATAQTITTTYRLSATTPTTGSLANGGEARETNSTTQFRQIVWHGTGTISTCSVRVDSSVDGTVWTVGGAIAAQACTTNGSSAVASGVFNFTRINITTLTGGGTLTVTYSGFPTNPGGGGGGTVTDVTATTPLQSSGGNTPNISFLNQTANTVLAGPATGGAAAPTFRALVAADIPAFTVPFSSVTAGINATALVMGTGGSLSTSGTGTIAATSVPWAGVSGTPTTIAGYGITNAIITNPAAGQTITNSASDGIHLEQFACASLDSNTQINAGCAAAYNTYVTNSVSTTQNNLRKGLNIYYQGNAQQGNALYGAQINAMQLQDANTSATNNALTGLEVNTLASGNNQTVGTLYAVDARPRIFSSAHVGRFVYYHGATVAAIPAGTTVDLLEGVTIGAAIAGTVTSSHGFGLDRNTFQYGLALGGSIRAGILDDTTAAISGLCHGLYGTGAPQTFTEHDCWFGGTGSPESAVTANIGSIFARQNGGAGTSFYVKESGTGNTGWQPVVTGGTTALSLATLSLSGQFTSTLATGTAPFVVASTTNVANLNASSLAGATFAAPGAIGGGTPSSGAFTTVSATGQITSTLATGTAPLVIASTTNVANLNASSLSGATFAAPGPIGSGTPSTGAFTTLSSTGVLSNSLNGAASTASVSVTGTPFTGGTGTTTFPLVYLNQGTGPSSFSTAGTELGMNAPSGFTGRFLDFHLNGGGSIFAVGSTGGITSSSDFTFSSGGSKLTWSGRSILQTPSDGVFEVTNNAGTDFTRLQFGGTTSSFPALARSSTTITQQLADGTTGGNFSSNKYLTATACANSASPAVCAGHSSGFVAIAAGTNPTLVVNTTAVTANSQIFLSDDESLGTALSVTCNTTLPSGAIVVTARTAATSFTIQATGVFTTNPVCVNYFIVN